MARRLIWSPEALEDIESIAEYIGRDSRFYARAVVSRLLDTAKAIPDEPLLGRKVPELNDEAIRERFVYSYRLVYRLSDAGVLIVAVIHGKRLIDNLGDRLG